jgi:hypothetical protein
MDQGTHCQCNGFNAVAVIVTNVFMAVFVDILPSCLDLCCAGLETTSRGSCSWCIGAQADPNCLRGLRLKKAMERVAATVTCVQFAEAAVKAGSGPKDLSV